MSNKTFSIPPHGAKLYLRISKDEAGQTSIADQERECRRKAASLGISSVQVYLEQPGTSGFKDVARPVFDDLLANLSPGDVVIAWALDRLSRKGLEQAGAILRRLEECQARLVTVSDGVDTDIEVGNDINVGIRAIMAREYSKGLSRNVKRGKETGAAAGKWGGGSRWFGYALDGGVWRGPLSIDPEQAKVLQEARQRYVQGDPIFRITKDFNQRRLYNVGGTPWRQHNLLRVLLNPRYAAVRVHNGQRYAGTWPAIFTLAEHEELLAARRSEQRMKTWPKSPTGARSYLLTGFTECGNCGGPLRGNARKQGSRQYRRYACCDCRSMFRMAEPLELLVSEAVLFRLDSADLARLLTHQDSRRGDVISLSRELEAKNLILNNLIDDYASGLLDRAQFARAKLIAETAVRAAETALQQSMGKWTNLHVDAGQTLRTAYQAGDLAWKRRLYSLLIDKVVVKKSNTGGRTAEHLWRGFRFSPSDVEIVWLV